MVCDALYISVTPHLGVSELWQQDLGLCSYQSHAKTFRSEAVCKKRRTLPQRRVHSAPELKSRFAEDVKQSRRSLLSSCSFGGRKIPSLHRCKMCSVSINYLYSIVGSSINTVLSPPLLEPNEMPRKRDETNIVHSQAINLVTT